MELREEISLHSQNVREFLGESHEIHMQALRAEFPVEHIRIMQRAIEFQRMAIKEAKKVNRLEKILINRERKVLAAQILNLSPPGAD